ncbi:hypothetical protein CcaCcLH18_10305 [Colletotrichum camelliae]|nr:hypothetical protein CcaCcLH18_10305 [Colletotrichum camelliae]
MSLDKGKEVLRDDDLLGNCNFEYKDAENNDTPQNPGSTTVVPDVTLTSPNESQPLITSTPSRPSGSLKLTQLLKFGQKLGLWACRSDLNLIFLEQLPVEQKTSAKQSEGIEAADEKNFETIVTPMALYVTGERPPVSVAFMYRYTTFAM